MSFAAGVGLPILVLTLGHVFSNAVRTLPAIAVDVLTRDLGISAEALAQITGAFPLSFAAAMIPVGVALDRYGVKRIVLVLLAVGALGAAMAALAAGPAAMLAAQVVLGVGCSGMLMCPITFAARRLSAARFALWSGIIQAFGNSGMLLSASPLALLVEALGWRAGFWACGALALLALPLILLLVPSERAAPPPRQSPLADAREVLRLMVSPELRSVVVFCFASFAAVLGLRGLWGGPWLMEVKGLDRIAAGNALLVCTIALSIGPALAGLVARRVGHVEALMAGSHLVCAGLILLVILGGPGGPFGALPVAWDVALLAAFGAIISFQVLSFSLVRAAVAPERTGRALSAGNISFFFGAAVMQALSGLAAGWGGIGWALASFSAGLVVCTLGFLALRRRQPVHGLGRERNPE